jgi:hypothetical protein
LLPTPAAQQLFLTFSAIQIEDQLDLTPVTLIFETRNTVIHLQVESNVTAMHH